MAWQNEVVPMLRILIADTDVEPEYSDTQLAEISVVAAKLIVKEIKFRNTYTITVSALTISPDPSTDEDFMNFMVLKAACLADHGQFRAKALLEGIRVNCGPTSLAVGGHLAGFKTLLEVGPCKTYEELKKQYLFSNNLAVRGIFGPFVGNNFDPRNLRHYAYSRTNNY